MVHYLDDENLLIDSRNLVKDEQDRYKDLETGERFILCSLHGKSDILEYVLDFGRLLRAKNFPQFAGFAESTSPKIINVCFNYTYPFREPMVRRYLTNLFDTTFLFTIAQGKIPHINGISYTDDFQLREPGIIFSSLEKKEFYSTLARLREISFNDLDIRFDLRPLRDHFSDDDWEQFCFGLFYFSPILTFVDPNSDGIISDDSERDTNFAHYGIKPKYLQVGLGHANLTNERNSARLEEIFLWIRSFALEVLFHEEQLLLEIAMGENEPGNLVTTVIGTMHEDTSLKRTRI